MKILLVAEHASAAFGGEALIPFQYFKRLREMGADVHLLVHARTRPELQQAFPQDLERLHFVADSRVNIWCARIGALLPARLAYFTLGAVSHLDTQIRQRRLARSLVRAHGFDIIHEPIPVSPKTPSMMFGLAAPVIIGPMNGGMDYPPHYNLDGRFSRAVISGLRRTAPFWNRVLPGKHRSALLLVANKRTYEALPAALKKKPIFELVENGVDVDLFKPELTRAKHEKFRVIYLGRLVDWKRVDLLIEACARLIGQVDFQLDLVGQGPLRALLEERAGRLNLRDHVRFWGRLPHSKAAELLRSADVMVLPSMLECGGAVVLEAMASAVPVIATHWGGPADYLDANTGILVPPATPERFIDELATAMLSMAKNPQARFKMGDAGRRKVAEFYDWRVKAKALLKIYEDLLTVTSNDMNNTAIA